MMQFKNHHPAAVVLIVSVIGGDLSTKSQKSLEIPAGQSVPYNPEGESVVRVGVYRSLDDALSKVSALWSGAVPVGHHDYHINTDGAIVYNGHILPSQVNTPKLNYKYKLMILIFGLLVVAYIFYYFMKK